MNNFVEGRWVDELLVARRTVRAGCWVQRRDEYVGMWLNHWVTGSSQWVLAAGW